MTELFEVITKEEFESSGAEALAPPIPSRRRMADWRETAPEVVTYDCEFCGNCETPNNCAWSRECPVCKAQPKDYCHASDGRITGLHAERW